ncbi:hypothetical protein NW762_009094 [Fusarium torreyae]|uniref:Uncharacterized protein n=1 Tax=Fusarium torreyae TaxID=1237075 RepID=A0A9W8RX46_9HYPO|nr:hypothetical protein NW762_009094 [Fusarium torreyae]
MNSWALHACHRKNGMFTGWFAPGQTKAMCPQLSGVGHRKVLFEVQNLNKNTGFDLGDGDCYTRLANEIEGCSDGGSSNVAGWRFRVDPDAC